MVGIKTILNKWILISPFIVIVLVLGMGAHLYLASCQTSKWHYIVQKYYCPSFYTPKLAPILKNNEWTTWHKNGKIESHIIAENSENKLTTKVWYKNGDLAYHQIKSSNISEVFTKRWSPTGTLLFKEIYNNKLKQNEVYQWFENRNSKSISFIPDNLINITTLSYYKNGNKKRNMVWNITSAVNTTNLKEKVFWHQNGQLKSLMKFKHGTAHFAYHLKVPKVLNNGSITKKQIFKTLHQYFYFNTLPHKLINQFISNDSKENAKRKKQMESSLDAMADSHYYWTEIIASKNDITFNIIICDQYDLNLIKTKNSEWLKKYKSDPQTELLEIKMRILPENSLEKINPKEYPHSFEFAYLHPTWTQFNAKGEIEFIQTHNEIGEQVKIEYFKNGIIENSIFIKDMPPRAR